MASGQFAIIYNETLLDQRVNDIVYSPVNRRLYASVPSTGGTYGNHVIAIDPFTKQIVGSAFVGSEPNRLAVSDNGQFLYVGLDGAASVRKVILATMTADITFGLGTGSFGLHYPEDIAVLPGQPNTIAVSRRNLCCSPRHEGVAIFENGVMRSTVTPGHTGSNVIEPGDSPNVLYGYNNETTDFGFRRMSVSSAGVSITSNLQGVISGFGTDIRYSGGLVYSTTGRIVNPVTNTLHGTFSVSGTANGLAPDARSRRVFFLFGNTLRVFNSENFQPVNSVVLSSVSHSQARLTRWGRRGFAYRTTDSKISIFETSLVPAQPNTSDFNGDEIGDAAVFRPQGALWFAANALYAYPFGISTDTPVSGDYDGDNKSDIAVYRSGTWYVMQSLTQTVRIDNFGIASDLPSSADFDGDHRNDLAVYRNGTWWVKSSSTLQVTARQFGLATDVPVPSDFDGDGLSDVAVYRPEAGTWFTLASSTGQVRVSQLGNSIGSPAPADYDGDGLSDIAVLQSSFGAPIYYIRSSRTGTIEEIALTSDAGAVPFPMDSDGDLTADPVVFEPAGRWYGRYSSTGQGFEILFGSLGDRTVR